MDKYQYDKRMQEILENYEKNSLGLDDTFKFKCRGCGKCCKNREDILLTARDLYNIALFLGRTTDYIVDRYCEVYIGNGSRMPIIRLRPSGPDNACPLLRNKRCIVHAVKPVVCAMFPLGRATNMQHTDNGVEMPGKIEPRYFIQPTTCGSMDLTQTVRSWLNQFGITAEDEFYVLWTETISFAADFFRSIEAKRITGKTLEMLWNVALVELYINYNTEKELIPQFSANAAKLKDAFTGVRSMADQIFGG